MKIAPLQSWTQLKCKLKLKPEYRQLTIFTAQNLSKKENLTIEEAVDWLENDSGLNDDEIIEEVNSCRDLM